LTIEIFMGHCGSLKQKRHIITGIKERLKSKYNVSVIEAGFQDKWQRSVIAAACISNKKEMFEKTFSGIMKFVESSGNDYEIIRDEIEFI